jgi:predicted nucleotidyltransferase
VKPSEIVSQHKDVVREIVAAHRARNPRIFGSIERGDDKPGSDLDLLVDALPGTMLLDLGAIQYALESRLGIAVDVVTPNDLPARFRGQVLNEAVPI